MIARLRRSTHSVFGWRGQDAATLFDQGYSANPYRVQWQLETRANAEAAQPDCGTLAHPRGSGVLFGGPALDGRLVGVPAPIEWCRGSTRDGLMRGSE
jgi:hypothetical protein